VGYEIIKLAKDGKVLFREPVQGWCCASVSVNPNDGSVWIAERDHSDNPNSKNQLWLRDAEGEVRRHLDLDDQDIFVVECMARTGDALFSGYNSGLRRASIDGKVSLIGDFAAKNIAVSRSTGISWVTTKDAVLRIRDDGSVDAKFPLTLPASHRGRRLFNRRTARHALDDTAAPFAAQEAAQRRRRENQNQPGDESPQRLCLGAPSPERKSSPGRTPKKSRRRRGRAELASGRPPTRLRIRRRRCKGAHRSG
jgi:hypothetical protein